MVMEIWCLGSGNGGVSVVVRGGESGGDMVSVGAEYVLATLNSRELQKMTEAKGDGGEGLYVRGISGQRDMEQGRDSMWPKSQGESNQTEWDALLTKAESMPKGAPIVDDNMSSKVLPNDPIVQSIYVHKKPNSYVVAAGGPKLKPSKAKANFCPLFSDNLCKCANVSIPKKLVETVSTRFANTLYGYFNGKHIAFPVVEYYVRNNWGKYGLTRILMNSKDFFFLQFKTSNGLEDVLENEPWMIRNSPIILKKWIMNTRLCKNELTRIPVCVKFHDVPIMVFSEEVLIPTTVVTPNVPNPTLKKTNDRFQTLGKNKKKGKSKSNIVGQIGGHPVKQNVRYEPKVTTSVPKKGATNVGNASQSSSMLKKQPTTTIASTKEGKERACVYFNFPFAIKLAISLNVFSQDPSTPPGSDLYYLFSLLNFYTTRKDVTLRNDIFDVHNNIKHDHKKSEIECAAGGKLCDKNTEESWEIIENLALYDHEGWNDSRYFVKSIKGTSSTNIPQAYVKSVSYDPHPQNLNEPPRQNSFTFQKCIRPDVQPQALETSFEARVRDYMAAHTERMKRVEDEKNVEGNEVVDKNGMEPDRSDATLPPKEVDKMNGAENRTEGGLKHIDALVDQGSHVNVMPLSIYNRLTDENPVETNIRLSLASHAYIYPLGIAEDVLVEFDVYVYLVDFMILDIKEDEKALHLRNTILDYN
ncbi:zinc knuckle CX2CX4HX4C containing protein [Tanacetum coccineum]